MQLASQRRAARDARGARGCSSLAALVVQAGYFAYEVHDFADQLRAADRRATPTRSIYYTLLGADHAHVFVGLLFASGCSRELAGGLTTYRVNASAAIAWYWHFVNVLTIVVDGRPALGARMSLRTLGILQWVGLLLGAARLGRPSTSPASASRRPRAAPAARAGASRNDVWQGALMGVALALVARRRGRRGDRLRAHARRDFGDGPPRTALRGALPARLHFFATAAIVANAIFLMIILLDGVASIADRRVPAGMRRRCSPLARARSPALRAAAAARPAPRPATRASTSTAATASPATAPNGSGVASAPGRIGAGPLRDQTQQRGIGPSLRGVGALAADFYLRTGYMPLPARRASSRAAAASCSRSGEIRDLTAYVASLGDGPADPAAAPRARQPLARGMHLFTDHCAGCHQIAAQGGYVTGARARRRSATRPPSQIAEAVRIGPVRDAALLEDGDLRPPARLDHRLRRSTRSTRTTAAAGRSATSAPCPRASSPGSSRRSRARRVLRRDRHAAPEAGVRAQDRLLAALALLLLRRRRPPPLRPRRARARSCPPAPPDPGGELARLRPASGSARWRAVAFVAVYALDRLPRPDAAPRRLARPRRCSASPPR